MGGGGECVSGMVGMSAVVEDGMWILCEGTQRVFGGDGAVWTGVV